jgi:hypothetical protein
MDPEDPQAQGVDVVTGADPAPAPGTSSDGGVTMSADEAYKNFIGPPTDATPWRQPIRLGPDPSTLGTPGASPNPLLSPLPPLTQPPTLPLPSLLAPSGPLAPTATPAPPGALSPSPSVGPSGPGGLPTLPKWITDGPGGNVGGQDVRAAPKFSTDGSHDLGQR